MAGDFDVSDVDYEADVREVCIDHAAPRLTCRKCMALYAPTPDAPRDAQPARLSGEVL